MIALGGCVADAMDPAGLQVFVVDARDTTWTALPGGDTLVRLRVVTSAGDPVRGAAVAWTPEGTGANISDNAIVTDRDGFASARWRVGTDARDRQSLQITVRHARVTREVVIRGRVIPSVVAALRVATDTPLVVRLGDTLAVGIMAVDPFGNVFAAPDLDLRIADSVIGRRLGAELIAGARRGTSALVASSGGHELRTTLRVVQYVARIVPEVDTLWLSSLGAQLPLRYTIIDDRGRLVHDSVAALETSDTAIVEVLGNDIRSRRTGFGTLRLSVGAVQSQTVVGVQQRIARLGLAADTVRFDALLDTLTLHPVAHDSLGSLIPHPTVVYEVRDSGVANVIVGGTLLAVAPGWTSVTVRDPISGVAASGMVQVRQQVAAIEVSALTFDALHDTQAVAAVARDRLGSVVPGVAFELELADAAVAAVVSNGRVRASQQGLTAITVRDPETGVTGTAAVVVAQRVVSLTIATDSIASDAVGDTVNLVADARDRLGSPVADPALHLGSSDSAVVALVAGRFVTTGNGAAFVFVRSNDGPADSAAVLVAQRIVGIVVARDTVSLTALNAVRNVAAAAVDRRGAKVPFAVLSYAVTDTSVASITPSGDVRAIANGHTAALVTAGGDSLVVAVRVSQQPYSIELANDTIRFDALGATHRVEGIVRDSLGFPIPDAALDLVVADTTVLDRLDSLTLRASANGTATASLSAGTATGSVVVEVDQVVATLSVSAQDAVFRLAAGAALPLACEARDRNEFLVDREATFVGSARGTVSGIGCRTVRVERSGYDTLVFALGGIEASVPVIVSTSPDSVGIAAAALALPSYERIRFEGEDLSHPSIQALRPLVLEILAEYGNPQHSLDRARALRDWVARTAVHPHAPLHPNGSTSNLGVLPPGKTWADVNALPISKFFDIDQPFWWSVGYDGYAMLDRLLGTLDPVTGARADDGMMEHAGGARYRIRDIATYHYTLCTFQAIILNTLWAAAGLHGMLISTVDHDPAAVFIPELGRWVYEDPTFNEEYLLDGVGDPLSPSELLAVSSVGQGGRLQARKMPGPAFDPTVYIPQATYTEQHPDGMVIMGSQLNNRVVGIGGWPARLVQIDAPLLDFYWPYSEPNYYARVSAESAFPTLGVLVQQVQQQDSVFVVTLGSTFPGHVRFERQLPGGSWEPVAASHVLPVGACVVQYRSVDALGNASAVAVLDVWAPRPKEFLQLGVRQQVPFCVSTP